jgi:transposase InsO family protein
VGLEADLDAAPLGLDDQRGLPRSLMTDNGSAMLADETRHGLARLGIVHETTLPHSPYQNAKQESFWAQLEGRFVAMLEKPRRPVFGAAQRADAGVG